MKRAFVRRVQPDDTQRLRHIAQLVFLALNIWIGTEFYFFIRQFETGGPVHYSRPPGVEGWLPISGLLNLKYALLTGAMPKIHPAAMVLLVAFLAIALFLRRSFCSWLCPVGTLSEWLWKLGRETFRRTWQLPRPVDLTLRSLKYAQLAFFFYAATSMTAQAIDGFQHAPFGLLADVSMLNFFRYLSLTSAIVLGVLTVAAVFIQNFWCRYLCPYGALLGLAALASPLRIKRNASTCIDCGKCTRACPSALPVDQLIQIRSAECIGCLECVASCPVQNTLELEAPSGRRISGRLVAAGIAALFLGSVAIAQATGHWQSEIPRSTYTELVPQARGLSH